MTDNNEFPQPQATPIEVPVESTPIEENTLDADDIFSPKVATETAKPEDTPVPADKPADNKSENSSDNVFTTLPPLTFDTPPHNVQLTTATVVEGEGLFPETLSLPSSAPATQVKMVSSFPNLKDMKDPKDLEWGQVFMQSMQMTPLDSAIDVSLSREGSDWQQSVDINGESLRAGIPRFKKTSNTEISGEQGMQMAYAHMGMGDFFHAPMWNSGFWVTFTPAPETVWLNINRILGTDVSGISRQTYGLLHSSATSLAVSTIINAILPYVYATSVSANEMPVKNIPQYLSNNDEHDFIWGFIASNYPQGVSIDRSCIADPNECRAVISEKLQVTELQIVDRSMIPMPNRVHMRSRGHGSMTLKSVQEYQQRLTDSTTSSITLTGINGHKAKFVLQVPSSEKKSRMSNAYVEEIQEAILATVTQDAPLSQRESLYEEHMTATELRLYQHWVSRIELDDDRNNAIVDEQTIAKTLGAWTRDTTLRAKFFEEMGKFINSSNLTAIGMEPAKCPKCGKDHTRPGQALRGKIDYIPLDVIQVFSFLADYKTRLILARV